MQRIVLIIILLIGVTVRAEEVNPIEKGDFGKLFKSNLRDKYPAGINLNMFGPIGLASISFDYFLIPKLALEVGAGIRDFNPDLGFSVGGRYHFLGKTRVRLTPYVGVLGGFNYNGSDLQSYNLYIPFGIHRVKRNQLNWSIEVAYQRNVDRPDENFYGGAKLGFRF